MKKLIIILAGLALVASAAFAQGTAVDKRTVEFAEKDGQRLYMDYYFAASPEARPCMIFMFGGAFARGERDRQDYIPFFHHLVERGINVASIDYRLGLKDIGSVPNLTDEVAAGMLVNSIRMAVEDLLDATNMLVNYAPDFNIDTDRIILCGSSAGAVSVLQTEYELCNGMHREMFCDGSPYAGVISFAGAVLTLDGRFSYGTAPSPMLLMHGDADRQVPYNELRMDNLGFYGSKYISDVLTTEGVPHAFYSYDNYGHEIASLPIRQYWDEIDSFLTHLVFGGEPVTVHQRLSNAGKPAVAKKDFTIADYLNGNFGL